MRLTKLVELMREKTQELKDKKDHKLLRLYGELLIAFGDVAIAEAQILEDYNEMCYNSKAS